jgi:hypothetical protein
MDLKNIKEGWINYIKRSIDRKSLTPELREKVESRAAICNQCPYLKVISKSNNRLFWGMCRKCGCVFPAIIYAESKKCPLDKW